MNASTDTSSSDASSGWTSAWLFFRALRWALWIAFIVWSVYFYVDRAPHTSMFGQLRLYAELMFFGLAQLAMFAGFLELMMRARAGLAGPRPFRLMAPKIDPNTGLSYDR